MATSKEKSQANRAATITGDSAGSVLEDGASIASGLLVVNDLDKGENQVKAIKEKSGEFGKFSISADGNWTYVLNKNSKDVQALAEGETVTEKFVVTSKDGSASKTVVVTVTGTNDVASIKGDTRASLTEDSHHVTARGELEVKDADHGQSSVQAISGLAGTYGSFSIDAKGHWTYVMDNSLAATQALAQGERGTDSFVVWSKDGSASQTVTVTLKGVNDEATITGQDTGSVSEDAAPNTATGKLIVNDVDNGENTVVPITAQAGAYGSFSIVADGSWTYTLDNSLSVVQSLPAGVTLTETFVVYSSDSLLFANDHDHDGDHEEDDHDGADRDQDGNDDEGHEDGDHGDDHHAPSYKGASKVVTVTIVGTNDAAVITGSSTGAVTEDLSLGVTGQLNVVDIDTGESSFQAQSNTVGSYGSLSITTDGAWSYSLNNGADNVQALAAGETATDIFVVKSYDGTEQQITLTITGTNDLASISGTSTGAVTEDTALATGAALAVADVDHGEAVFQAQASVAATYGSFAIGTDGNWTYQLNNSAANVQALAAGEQVTDSFTVVSKDGTASQLITVTITGTNDGPVVTNSAAAAAGAVAEDGTLSATGQLSASDVDNGATQSWSVAGAANGTYGAIGIDAASGQWTYNLNNAAANVQALAAGETHTETFTVRVTDDQGATADQQVNITVTGSNDGPVVTNSAAAAAGAVAEDGTLSATGQLSASDVDNGATQSWSVAGTANGAYGAIGIDAASGQWTYNLNNDAANVQALAAGETHTETFTLRVIDDQGASADQQVSVTVTGSNDGPVVADQDVVGAVKAVAQESSAPVTKPIEFTVQQYLGHQSNSLADLRGYAASHTANYTVQTNVIDYTDDPAGFAGELPGSNRWPAAQATGASQTYDYVNNTFFARITADFSVGTADTYTFRTFNDDGVFLLIDNTLVISDTGYHPEYAFTGSIALTPGNHTIELFFFENGGEASLEFSARTSTGSFGLVGSSGGGFSGGVSQVTDTGRISFSDVDLNDVHLVSASGTPVGSTLGTLSAVKTHDTTGSGSGGEIQWTYTAPNSALVYLAEGQTKVESFTITLNDQHGGVVTKQIDVTLTGTNERASISGVSSGAVGEDASLATGGALVVADLDQGEAHAQATTAVGNYGDFAVDANGQWSYALNNGAANVQALAAGQSVTETFTVTSQDGTASQSVNITITGSNDGPVVTNAAAAAAGAVSEDGVLSATGQLSASDVDNGATQSWSVVGAANGTYGAIGIDAASGQWTYNLNNSAANVQALAVGETHTETFTLRVTDDQGATADQNVSVVVRGTNDAPVAQNDANALSVTSLASQVRSTTVNWVDWTSSSKVGSSGTVNGTINLGNGQTIGVTYTGEFAFAQTNGGTNFYTGPASTYTSAAVANAPTGSDIIALHLATQKTLTFSQPVDNLFFAVVSLNGNGYLFDQDFQILSYGQGYWGAGSASKVALADGRFKVVGSGELHGMLGIEGSVQSLTWSSASNENWNGFTVGTYGKATTATATGNVLGNDSDVDTGDVLSVSHVNGQGIVGNSITQTLASGAQVKVNKDGSYLYDENSAFGSLAAGQTYTDSFSYTVTDGKGGSSSATTSVTITGINDGPVVTNSAAAAVGAVAEDGALTVTGQLSASDVDNGATQSWSVVGAANGTYGTIGIDAASGQWTYSLSNAAANVQALAAGESHVEAFTVRVTDDQGAFVDQQVKVTVTGSNDGPVIATQASAVQTLNFESGMYSDGSYLHVSDGYGGFNWSTSDTTYDGVAADILGGSNAGVFSGSSAAWNGYASKFSYITLQDAAGTFNFEGANFHTYSSASQIRLNGYNNGVLQGSELVDLTSAWQYTTSNLVNIDQLVIEVTAGTASGNGVSNTGWWGMDDFKYSLNSGAQSAAVREDVTLSATGQLSASDVDNGATQSWSVAGAANGAYGAIGIDAASGQWTYNLNNSAANVQALAAGETHTETFTLRVTDDKGATADQSVSVVVTGSNDGPTGSATAVLAAGTEDTAYTVSAASLLAGFSDLDNGAVLSVAGLTASNGSVVNNGNGTYTITPTANFNGAVTLNYNVVDGQGGSVAATQSYNLAAVNDAPVLQGTMTEQLYTSSLSVWTPFLVNNGVWVTPTGASSGDTAPHTFVRQFTAAQDGNYVFQFAVDNEGSVLVDGVAIAGLYNNDWAHSTVQTVALKAGIHTVTMNALNWGGPAAFAMNIRDPNNQEIWNTRTHLNPEPLISSYTENQAPMVISAGLTLTDIDSPTISHATVSVAAGFAAGQDVLGFVDQNGITGSYDASTGVLSLSGAATQAQYQTALRSVTYSNSSDAPSTADRTINFAVDDGAGQFSQSNTVQSPIVVVGVNDVATISGTATGTVTEDTTLSASGTLTVADPDAGQAVFVAQSAVAGTYGSFSIDAAGQWTYSLNNAAANVQALNTGTTVNDSFTVWSQDGTASQVVSVAVNGLDDNRKPVAVNDTLQSVSGSGVVIGFEAGTYTQNGNTVVANGYTFTPQNTTNTYNGIQAYGPGVTGGWGYNNSVCIYSYAYSGSATNPSLTTMPIEMVRTDGSVFALDKANITGYNYSQTGTLIETVTGYLNGIQVAQESFTLVNSSTGARNGLVDLTATGFNAVDRVEFKMTLSNSTSTNPHQWIDNIALGGGMVNLLANDSDPDAGATLSINSYDAVSTLGASVAVSSSGVVTYNASNVVSVKALAAGETAVDTFTYDVKDQFGAVSNRATVSYTVTGSNDVATLSGTTTGNVKEDVTASATGRVLVTDADHDQSFAKVVSGTSTYGSYSVDVNGNWTYNLNNSLSSVQALSATQTLSDSFAVTSADGSATQQISVSIAGSNDAPVAANDTINGGVLTFENGTYTQTNNQTGTTVTTGDFSFTGSQLYVTSYYGASHSATLYSYGYNYNYYYWYGYYGNSQVTTPPITMTKTGGGSFSLESANLTGYSYGGGSPIETVTGYLNGVQVASQSFSVPDTYSSSVYDNKVTLTHPGFAAVDKVVFSATGTSGYYNLYQWLDNISVPNTVTKVSNVNVLANDTDIDSGAVLSIGNFSATSAHGAAISLNADGTLHYDPTVSAELQAVSKGVAVQDSFTYQTQDQYGALSNTATVTVNLVGIA